MRIKITNIILSICILTTGFALGRLSISHKKCNDSIYSYKANVNDLEKEVQRLNEQILSMIAPTDLIEETNETSATVYDCIALSENLQQFTYEQCYERGIAEYYELMLAVMWHESDFDYDAISPTNDYGIMQINICNHSSLRNILGITDFLDVKQNITAGVYMLSDLLHKYGSESKALMAYNIGESGAKTLWSKGIYTSAYATGVLTKKELIKSSNIL